jgi:hypothetical protein
MLTLVKSVLFVKITGHHIPFYFYICRLKQMIGSFKTPFVFIKCYFCGAKKMVMHKVAFKTLDVW